MSLFLLLLARLLSANGVDAVVCGDDLVIGKTTCAAERGQAPLHELQEHVADGLLLLALGQRVAAVPAHDRDAAVHVAAEHLEQGARLARVAIGHQQPQLPAEVGDLRPELRLPPRIGGGAHGQKPFEMDFGSSGTER